MSGGGGGGEGVWEMKRLHAEEMEHPSSNLINDGVILPHETREASYHPATRGCGIEHFNLFVGWFVLSFPGSVTVFRSVFEVFRITSPGTSQTSSKCAANVMQLVS